MIASNKMPYVVEFRIVDWDEAFPQALERLYQSSGVVQIGLKAWQSRTVPRNRVFCYMHPRERGCVVVRHHFEDWEDLYIIRQTLPCVYRMMSVYSPNSNKRQKCT